MIYEWDEVVKEACQYTDIDLCNMSDYDFKKFVEDIYFCKYFGLPKDGKFPSESDEAVLKA